MAEKNGVDHNKHILDNHEERVQRLEDERVIIATQISEQNTTLRAVLSQLKSDADKFEKLLSVVDKHVTASDLRFIALEKREEAEKDRIKWIRSIVYAVITASAGAAGTLILQKLLH